MAVFIIEDALSVWTNLGKHSLFVWLFVSRVKTGTRRITRLDELSSIVQLERRTTEDSSFRRIMRLVPVFTLETNNECLHKFVQTDNASSSIKTAIVVVSRCCPAEDGADLFIRACHTCSTIIFPHSTNQILNLWRFPFVDANKTPYFQVQGEERALKHFLFAHLICRFVTPSIPPSVFIAFT